MAEARPRILVTRKLPAAVEFDEPTFYKRASVHQSERCLKGPRMHTKSFLFSFWMFEKRASHVRHAAEAGLGLEDDTAIIKPCAKSAGLKWPGDV
jgi:hypothetical protein